MSNQFPWDQFDRVTFERGICIERDLNGAWRYLNSRQPIAVSNPGNVLASLGVRPVLAEGRHESGRVSFLLPSTKGHLLDIYRDELTLPKPMPFMMDAMLFHCSTLTKAYADACIRFVDASPKNSAGVETSSGRSENPVVIELAAPFFQFDALLTTLIIGYEAIRQPILKVHASGKETTRSFADIATTGKLSSAIQKRLQLSRDNCYLPAKRFRHCIHHHLDIAPSSWCRFENKFLSLWSLKVGLPDNPTQKSAAAFTFEKELDVLTVAWEYVSEFFALADTMLGKGELSAA